jgi:hypothetical protein
MSVEPVHSDPDIIIYRVDLPPSEQTCAGGQLCQGVQVSGSAPLASLYFGQGWGAIPDRRADEADPRIWAQRRDVQLFVPLEGGAQVVGLRLFAPGEDQRLTVSTDGWRSDALLLDPGWGEYTLALPAETVKAGLNQIHFGFDQLYPIASLAQNEGALALLVESAGQEVGDFGHIYLNGVDVSPYQRGYNLVVISPQGDTVVASFDTHLDSDASTAMAQFIAAVPEGHTVAVAAADEASMNLGEEAVTALRSIGAAGDLRERFRWSHAVIGVKGTEPGSALEALDGLRPVSVAVGPPVTEPSVAAAVEWIRFKSSEQ